MSRPLFIPLLLLCLGAQAITPPPNPYMAVVPAPSPVTNSVVTNRITGTWDYTNAAANFTFGWLTPTNTTNWINCGASLACAFVTTNFPQQFFLFAQVGTNNSPITNGSLSVDAPPPQPPAPSNMDISIHFLVAATNQSQFFAVNPTNVMLLATNRLGASGSTTNWIPLRVSGRVAASRTYATP